MVSFTADTSMCFPTRTSRICLKARADLTPRSFARVAAASANDLPAFADMRCIDVPPVF